MRPIHIGLALSGGTAKSVAHIGVLKALDEAGIVIDRVAATSGGSIVAAYYCAGIPIEEIAAKASSMKLTDLGRIGFRRLGFLSSDKLYRMVVDAIGDVTFEQLRIPLSIIVTNLQDGREEALDSGPVAKAAQASSCIPQIYAPVEMNGSLYVDGGLVEYMPTRALEAYEPPLVVGVNLGFHRKRANPPRHMLALIMHTMGLVAQQNAAVSERAADVCIKPDLSEFNSFEIREAEAMIEVGYREAMRCLPDIERAWERHYSLRGRVGSWWRRVRGPGSPNARLALPSTAGRVSS